MPEAVIVSAARSPIGRANKGSLKDFRPDDLAATHRADRAGQGPGPRPHHVDDLYLGCGLPGGECGFNMAPRRQRPQRHGRRARRHRHPLLRLVGADHPDGVPRDQGRRGRRLRLRRRRDGLALRARAPPTTGPTPSNPLFADAEARTDEDRRGRAMDWHDPREDGLLPDAYIAMGQTAENVARLRGLVARGARRVRRPLAEPRREGHQGRLLGPRDHPGHHPRRHGRLAPTTARAPASRSRRHREPQAGLPPRRRGHRRQLLPAQRRRRRGRDHVRHQGRRARPHAAGPDRLHRRQRPLPRDHGPRPGRGDQAGAGATPA